MAERRPVTATEIRRDVEGYSDMTEDAFARRFYADRAELDALGIHLSVDKPADGLLRAGELLARARGVPPAADRVHRLRARRAADRADAARRRVRLRRAAAARAAADRLGPPEPARHRLAPDDRARHHGVGRRRRALRRGWRRSTPRSTAASGSSSSTTRWAPTRPRCGASTRTTCCSRAGSSTSSATRTSATTCASSGSRGSAGKVAYATKAEHDFQRPADFDPRGYANRIPWQLGDQVDVAEVEVPEGVAWYVERQYGAYGTLDGQRLPHRATRCRGC